MDWIWGLATGANWSWPEKTNIEYWSFLATLFGFPFAIAAAIYGGRQLALSRKAGSGATLIAINETLRQCWLLFMFSEDANKRNYAFADLVNSIEMACAIYNDRIFFGASRKILGASVMHTLHLFEERPDAITAMIDLLESPETFENVVTFISDNKHEFPKLAAAIRSPSLAQ